MTRPNEPDTVPKRTKKVRLGIYRTQICPKTRHYFFVLASARQCSRVQFWREIVFFFSVSVKQITFSFNKCNTFTFRCLEKSLEKSASFRNCPWYRRISGQWLVIVENHDSKQGFWLANSQFGYGNWYASAAYQASLVEPWFVFWWDVVEPKYPWWD